MLATAIKAYRVEGRARAGLPLAPQAATWTSCGSTFAVSRDTPNLTFAPASADCFNVGATGSKGRPDDDQSYSPLVEIDLGDAEPLENSADSSSGEEVEDYWEVLSRFIEAICQEDLQRTPKQVKELVKARLPSTLRSDWDFCENRDIDTFINRNLQAALKETSKQTRRSRAPRWVKYYLAKRRDQAIHHKYDSDYLIPERSRLSAEENDLVKFGWTPLHRLFEWALRESNPSQSNLRKIVGWFGIAGLILGPICGAYVSYIDARHNILAAPLPFELLKGAAMGLIIGPIAGGAWLAVMIAIAVLLVVLDGLVDLAYELGLLFSANLRQLDCDWKGVSSRTSCARRFATKAEALDHWRATH